MKKITRNKKEGKIFGVCAGVAEYFEVDVSLVRVVWAVSACMGIGITAYLLSALILPKKEEAETLKSK